MTSSSVPWITSTGDVTFGTLSILGNASKNHVLRVAGNATRIPDINGECNITAPTSYLNRFYLFVKRIEIHKEREKGGERYEKIK